MSPQTLLTLPPEIRNMIWAEFFAAKQGKELLVELHSYDCQWSSIALTCRQLHSETQHFVHCRCPLVLCGFDNKPLPFTRARQPKPNKRIQQASLVETIVWRQMLDTLQPVLSWHPNGLDPQNVILELCGCRSGSHGILDIVFAYYEMVEHLTWLLVECVRRFRGARSYTVLVCSETRLASLVIDVVSSTNNIFAIDDFLTEYFSSLSDLDDKDTNYAAADSLAGFRSQIETIDNRYQFSLVQTQTGGQEVKIPIQFYASHTVEKGLMCLTAPRLEKLED